MNKFLKSHLLDAYNWNCDHSQFCNKSTDLLQKPFFSLQVSKSKKNLKYLDIILKENEEELTLIFAKKLLPFYGFNPKKIQSFQSLEILNEYSKSRLPIELNFESVYGHFILISVYEQNFKLPNIHFETYKRQTGVLSYLINSVKTRYYLKNLAKETKFSLISTDIKPIYDKFSWAEKILIKLFSFMEKK